MQYNGCKWKGGKLRVEIAKPNYLLKLRVELDAEATDELHQRDQLQNEEEQAADAAECSRVQPLQIPVPGRKHKVWMTLINWCCSFRAYTVKLSNEHN